MTVETTTEEIATAVSEKHRAKLAKCLTQFRNENGKKLPQTPAGIAEHRRFVKEYEKLIGRPVSAGSKKKYETMYAGILRSIELNKKKPDLTPKPAPKKKPAAKPKRKVNTSRLERSLTSLNKKLARAQAIYDKHMLQITKDLEMIKVLQLSLKNKEWRKSRYYHKIIANLKYYKSVTGRQKVKAGKVKDRIKRYSADARSIKAEIKRGNK